MANDDTLRSGRINSAVSLGVSIAGFASLALFGWGKQTGVISLLAYGAMFAGNFISGLSGLFSSITLDSVGFTTRTVFSQRRYRWDQINPFIISRYRLSSRMVAFDFANSDERHFDRGRSWWWRTFVSDHDVVLPSRFGLAPKKLAETLNQWRLHESIERSAHRAAIVT